MQSILVKMVFKLVIKAINKKYDMKSIDNYVHKDNMLDKKVSNMEVILKKVLENSHPPVFDPKDYKKLLKRVEKLEKKKECKVECTGKCIQ